MFQPYHFHSKLILRTPSLPFNEKITVDFIKSKLNDRHFMEALYLASPVLHEEALNWKEGKLSDPRKIQKLTFSLSKYYLRMSTRCTPFGLFAGCAVAEWAEETDLVLDPEQSSRNTRLDMHYSCALAQKLAEIPQIKQKLVYFPNSSIYRIADEIRYVEYKYINGQRTHQISAITSSEYIEKVLELCKNGSLPDTMIMNLMDDDISEDEAASFIDELINVQLLVNELEPSITGEEFTQQILKVIQKINHSHEFDGIVSVLEEIEKRLEKIDHQGSNEAELYGEITRIIEQLNVPFEDGKLFQTDLVKHLTTHKVNQKHQKDLEDALYVLSLLSLTGDNNSLAEFRSKFFDRYEGRSMPLLEVLDTEMGIGYGNSGKTINTPITEGIALPQNAKESGSISVSKNHKFLIDKWKNAIKNNDFIVEIKEEDLSDLQAVGQKMPPSFPVMFRLTGDEKFQVLIENAGGSSAANLLGRFAHADQQIAELICEITEEEQKRNPAVDFAEIVHLPESRVGNILLHPVFRNFEIPYLAKSSLPTDQQLNLENLEVSVDILSNKITLKSAKTGKEVIPRLSNAHNFSYNALPVYHFLADLQTQNLASSLGIRWKSILPESKFTPRLTYKSVILEPAGWNFEKADIEHIIQADSEKLLEEFSIFAKKWSIPRYFLLSEGDNELLIDSENLLSLQTWFDSVKNKATIPLKEFVFNAENLCVKDLSNQGYTNQFAAILLRDEATYEQFEQRPVEPDLTTRQRDFSLGSEWLYYKFYCGIKSSDKILTEAFGPLVTELIQNQLIDKWFFIRYADPEKHLRVRFHIPHPENLTKVILLINQFIRPFEEIGIIHKTFTATYQRELERYGANTIELTEQLFFEDSNAVLGMLSQTWGDERDQIRWQWGLKAIDHYLDAFRLELVQKYNLLENMKDSFGQEFKMNKSLRIQLDQKFRENRSLITKILDNDSNNPSEYEPLFEYIYLKSEKIRPIVEQILILKTTQQLSLYLRDTIHMCVNRIISDNQRLHELVMYDFLFNYYRSKLARMKKK